jgi:hypothetical protein
LAPVRKPKGPGESSSDDIFETASQDCDSDVELLDAVLVSNKSKINLLPRSSSAEAIIVSDNPDYDDSGSAVSEYEECGSSDIDSDDVLILDQATIDKFRAAKTTGECVIPMFFSTAKPINVRNSRDPHCTEELSNALHPTDSSLTPMTVSAASSSQSRALPQCITSEPELAVCDSRGRTAKRQPKVTTQGKHEQIELCVISD